MATIQTVIAIIIGVILFVAVAIPIAVQVLHGVTTANQAVNESFAAPSNATTAFSYTVKNTPINALYGAPNFVFIENTTGTPASVLTSPANFSLAGYNSASNSYNGTIVFTGLNLNTSAGGIGTALLATYGYQQQGFDGSSTDSAIYSVIPVGIAVAVIVFIFTMIGAGI